MTLAHPKPARRSRKAPRPLRRSSTIGAKRRAAKAAGCVEPETWAAICDFYRDERGLVVCAYGCGRPATEQDHVKPLARGGKHEPSNVVPADIGCNQRKGTQTWEPVTRHPWMVK